MPGKHIYVREIKLHPLTFVNTAIIIANGTEGVLSTLVANGTGTVSTIVTNGSERVKLIDKRVYVMAPVLQRYITMNQHVWPGIA